MRFLARAVVALAFAMAAGHLMGACLTTQPPNPTHGSTFSYGTKELWTMLRTDGRWLKLPYDSSGGGFRQKVVWWSDEFDWRKGPKPNLTVTGRRLDGDAPAVVNIRAARWGSGIITLLGFPTQGCWEVTGHYNGRTLTFVVLIEP